MGVDCVILSGGVGLVTTLVLVLFIKCCICCLGFRSEGIERDSLAARYQSTGYGKCHSFLGNWSVSRECTTHGLQRTIHGGQERMQLLLVVRIGRTGSSHLDDALLRRILCILGGPRLLEGGGEIL